MNYTETEILKLVTSLLRDDPIVVGYHMYDLLNYKKQNTSLSWDIYCVQYLKGLTIRSPWYWGFTISSLHTAQSNVRTKDGRVSISIK